MADYFKLLRSSCYAMAAFFAIAVLPFSQLPIEGLGVFAQEEEEKKYKNVETRKRESVGKTCSSALDKVIGEKGPVFLAQAAEDAASQAESLNKKMKEDIQNAKTKDEKALFEAQYKELRVSQATIDKYMKDAGRFWKDGERALLNIDRKEKTCASDYEKIQVWNYLAYTYYSLDDFKKAIVYYEYIVNSPGEDDAFRLDTRRTLAQFYAQQERYLEAITQYEIWEAQAFSVGASDRLMMAQLYNVLELSLIHI